MKEEEIINILQLHSHFIKDDFKWLSEKLFQAWPETQIYTGEWLTFALYNQSRLVLPNANLCKNTIETLSYIPGVINAGFSTIKPLTYIKPHRGYTNKVYRYHLGIDIPYSVKYECGLIIYPSDGNKPDLSKDYIKWKEGCAFKFDDTMLHSACNYTNKNRTVLLIDVLK